VATGGSVTDSQVNEGVGYFFVNSHSCHLDIQVEGKGICSYFRAGLEWGRFGEWQWAEEKIIEVGNGYLPQVQRVQDFFFSFLFFFLFFFIFFLQLQGRSVRVRSL
jgi:hypothetical protein